MSNNFAISTRLREKIKNNEESRREGLCLFELCTTPARELNRGVSINYGTDTEIDRKFLRELIGFYEGEIAKAQESQTAFERELEANRALLPKCENQTAYDLINIHMAEIMEEISAEIENREEYQGYLRKLEWIEELMRDNNKWEFWYYFS